MFAVRRSILKIFLATMLTAHRIAHLVYGAKMEHVLILSLDGLVAELTNELQNIRKRDWLAIDQLRRDVNFNAPLY